MGCGLPEGATGQNVGRLAAIWAGCPVTTSGTTINRFCSSGLQAIAVAAGRVINEGVPIAIGAGVESISLVQGTLNVNRITEEKLMQTYPALWMPMIDTADIVAARYNISRERQDRFSLESQKPHGRRPASRQVRRRNRADGNGDDRRQQGNRRNEKRSVHGDERRMQPPRHDV